MNKENVYNFIKQNISDINYIKSQISKENLKNGKKIFLDIFFVMNNGNFITIYESDLYEENNENLKLLIRQKKKIINWLKTNTNCVILSI